MSTVDSEINNLKRYFKHHRLVTYAMLGFIVLLTLVFISSNRLLTEQITYQSNASEPVSCGNYDNSCYRLSFSDSDIQIRGSAAKGGACYRLVNIICTNPGRRCSKTPINPFGCYERWNTGVRDPNGQSCAKRGACDGSEKGTWEWAAFQICGCTNSLPVPPTAVPPTPLPTDVPLKCGDGCGQEPSSNGINVSNSYVTSSSCAPGLICRGVIPCQPRPGGPKCPNGTPTNICVPADCTFPDPTQCVCPFNPTPTAEPVTAGCIMNNINDINVDCTKPGHGCPPENTCSRIQGKFYCCHGPGIGFGQ